MPERDLFWENLFRWIDERRVIPIVGQDLLVMRNGTPRLLYRILADKIAAAAGLPSPPESAANPLHALACEYVAHPRALDPLEPFYSLLANALRETEALPLPEPLLQLAAVDKFSLFVSTTFDPFLAKAIDTVRFRGTQRTEVLSFSPYSKDDLGTDSATEGRPTVFHLLGKMSLMNDYAVTEEDTLEFVHALQTESKCPARLFDELDGKQLLLIGSGFSDWLTRFLLRTAKRERLWMARGRMDFVADASVAGETPLASFLQHFSSKMRLFDGNPIDFVAELSRRWAARSAAPSNEGVAPPITPMRPGAVFVSYASEDRVAASGIVEALKNAGLNVFYDRVELQPGDPWEPKILLNIENASAFIPIISRNTLTPVKRFFRVEWDHAAKIAVRFPPSREFICPVVIDDTPRGHQDIPQELRARQWVSAADLPTSGLLDRLQNNVRLFEQQTAGRA